MEGKKDKKDDDDGEKQERRMRRTMVVEGEMDEKDDGDGERRLWVWEIVRWAWWGSDRASFLSHRYVDPC